MIPYNLNQVDELELLNECQFLLTNSELVELFNESDHFDVSKCVDQRHKRRISISTDCPSRDYSVFDNTKTQEAK